MRLDSYSDNYYKYYQNIIKDPTIAYPPIEGMIMKEEQEWLFDRASEMESVVEIGSWTGMSTYALCAGCKGSVYAIDTFEGTDDEIDGSMSLAKTGKLYEIFMKNVGHFKNLIPMKITSELASELFEPKSIDMIFIDGDHRYEAIIKDLTLWFPICKKFLCGHDRKHEGVQKALQEFGLFWMEVPELAMWYISLGD